MDKFCRDGDGYRYGDEIFRTVDEAYLRFRREYNSVVKSAYHRLSRIGQRTERVHGTWMYHSKDYVAPDYPDVRIKAYMLGLIETSYCKCVGIWDIPYEIPEGEEERWTDWIFGKDCKALRMMGRRLKTGRTAKRNIKH